MTDYGEGQYFDEGSGGDNPWGDEYGGGLPGDAYGLPADNWVNNPELVTFADQFITAAQNSPELVQQWYETYAKERGLRQLAEEVAEAEQISVKLGENPREFSRQVAAAFREARKIAREE